MALSLATRLAIWRVRHYERQRGAERLQEAEFERAKEGKKELDHTSLARAHAAEIARAPLAAARLGQRRAAAIGLENDPEAVQYLTANTILAAMCAWYKEAAPLVSFDDTAQMVLAVMGEVASDAASRLSRDEILWAAVHRPEREIGPSPDAEARVHASFRVATSTQESPVRAKALRLLTPPTTPRRISPANKWLIMELSNLSYWRSAAATAAVELAEIRAALAVPVVQADLPVVDRIVRAELASRASRKNPSPPEGSAEPVRIDRAERRWRQIRAARAAEHRRAAAEKIMAAQQALLLANDPATSPRNARRALCQYPLRMAEAIAELDAARMVEREERRQPSAKGIGPRPAVAPALIHDPYIGDRRHTPGVVEALAKGLPVQTGATGRGSVGVRDDPAARVVVVRRMAR